MLDVLDKVDEVQELQRVPEGAARSVFIAYPRLFMSLVQEK